MPKVGGFGNHDLDSSDDQSMDSMPSKVVTSSSVSHDLDSMKSVTESKPSLMNAAGDLDGSDLNNSLSLVIPSEDSKQEDR